MFLCHINDYKYLVGNNYQQTISQLNKSNDPANDR